MFFQKKGKLRKEYDDKLIVLLEKVKNEWLRQTRCHLFFENSRGEIFLFVERSKASSCKNGTMVKGSAF